MKWAIWKRNTDDFIDDNGEGDNVCFEERVILKRLKLTADQRYLRRFLEEALVFYNVEPHENLAQVRLPSILLVPSRLTSLNFAHLSLAISTNDISYFIIFIALTILMFIIIIIVKI